jgi:hypothetical protein
MSGLHEREHSEFLLLYKNTAEDIDRAKREQWSHFYAVLVAQVGVAGFSQLELAPSGAVIFSALAVLLGIGILVLVLHQVRLSWLRRLVKNQYLPRLEESTRTILESKEAQSVHRLIVPSLMVLVLVMVFIFLVIVTIPGGGDEAVILQTP